MRVILASASPRRRELMGLLFKSFEVIPPDVAENADPEANVEDIPRRIARTKAEAVAQNNPGALIIAADTVVEIDGEILGKPADPSDACEMLKKLSGKIHRVYTGVWIICGSRQAGFTEKTDVEFYPLSQKEIEAYVRTGDPLDKAGAYGIQGRGYFLVKGISGDYCNVMGLPTARLKRELEKIGVDFM